MRIELHRRIENTLIHEEGNPHGSGGGLHELAPYMPGRPAVIVVRGVVYELTWESGAYATGDAAEAQETGVDPSDYRKALSRMKRYRDALRTIIEKMRAQIAVRRKGGARNPVPGHVFDVLNVATGALMPPTATRKQVRRKTSM